MLPFVNRTRIRLIFDASFLVILYRTPPTKDDNDFRAIGLELLCKTQYF